MEEPAEAAPYGAPWPQRSCSAVDHHGGGGLARGALGADAVSGAYRLVEPGGGLFVEAGDRFDFACCTCGNVHAIRVEVSPYSAGGLVLWFDENRRATAGIRRGKRLRDGLRALVARFKR